MSRASAGDTVVVKPTNNIYTVLSAVGLVVVILGLVSIYLRADSLFPGGLLGDPPTKSAARR